ncbi:MAG: carbon-nitrogen hydrolase family protein [Opitutaceae bacterium]|nr:carbon-nitrogen hydrolase family protein [Opitutaceae bacterium]
MKRANLFQLALLAAFGAGLAAAGADEANVVRRVKVAAISFVPVKLDLAGNADRLEAALREAAAGGAQLAVAPEGILDGYAINPMLAGEIPVARMRDVAVPLDGPEIARFRRVARELALCVVFGFAERIGDDVFNTAVFIDDRGEVRGKYHKMQLAEGYHSAWWFNRLGARSRAFDTPFGRCGVLICNDRWNPALARIPALDGAQFLVIPSFGSTSTAQDEAVLGRARETGLPVVEANVGVTLVVSGGEIVAVRRDRTAVTFAEIAIPPARPAQPAARDAAEREFLTWREAEMPARYESKRHRLSPAEAASARFGPAREPEPRK